MDKSNEGFFCVLLGADGSGKTSLFNRMRQERPGWKYVSAQPFDLYPIRGLEYMSWALETHPREYVKRMPPLTRTLFFMKTLAIEYEYHIAPALASGSVVICDSYFYRFMSKERVHNPATNGLFEVMRRYLPPPDLILWLDVPLAVAYRRKPTLSEFEVGGDYSQGGFVDFQREVLMYVSEMIEGLPVTFLNAERPPCEVLTAALEKIREAAVAGRA